MTAAFTDFLSHRTATGRWSRLGPYYAMLPLALVNDVLDLYTQTGQTVIDPFCNRGTVPYIAMAKGIRALGCDLNPVAWLYARTKTRSVPLSGGRPATHRRPAGRGHGRGCPA